MNIFIKTTATALLAIGMVGACMAQESTPVSRDVEVEKKSGNIIEFKDEDGKGFSINIDLENDELESKIEREIEKAIDDEMGDLSEEKLEKFISQKIHDKSDWSYAFLIPILGIIFGCSIPIAIVGFVLLAKHKRRKMMHETIAKMVEKGMEIPPHLLEIDVDKSFEDGGKGSSSLAFRRGVIVSGVGVGLMFFFGIDGGVDDIGIGALVTCIGLAYLLVWKLESKQEHNQEKESESE